ncbi:MAG: hypothetical protein U5L98_05070 [Halomonas sp.]|uniref:hypothetical protein n=1 Tax=Halomonas sp. TaxID=1486246 RepID=UPI002ACF01E6|nr:hypothetical protein [Halomonas sp.]MDZ7852025.1 hypothetical protein [Halomonas sp.]
MREAWPERWEKFCKANPQAPEQVFVQKVGPRAGASAARWKCCATASRCRV